MLHSWCSYLSLLLIEATVLLCLISTVSCYQHDDLVLLPHDPVVEDGHWLTLNCTILPHYTGNYTSHDLYFVHNRVNFTNFTTDGSKTALLKLQWTLSADGKGGGHIKCLLPDRTLVFPATQSVTVVRRPLQPNITGCLLWNLDHVNCSWQPSGSQQQQHMHTHRPLIQTLQWKLRDEVNDVWQDAPCKGEVTDSCLWNISNIVHRFVTSESCCVHIFARVHFDYNDLHFEVQSTQFCFRPKHSVVLDKPRSLTADNQTQHQISIQWQAPLLDLSHVSSAGTELVYAVIVLSQWTETPIRNQSVVIESLSFTSVPYTTYAVSVKVKTVESQYWSSPNTIKFTTPPAIPKMSPPSTSNAFTVSYMEDYTRTVIIYWQALSVEDYYGPSLSYIVLMRNPPALVWIELSVVKSTDSPCPCSEVVVDAKADVELSVIARNEVGDTSSDVVLHLPAVQSSVMTNSLFTEFVVELTNDSMVMFSWLLKSSELAGNLTLFWCRSRFPLGRCADSIQWLDTAASKSEYNLTIDAKDTNHYHYGAALKAESIYTENSGIEWVGCLYNVHGLAAPVQNLKAVVPRYGDAGQLLVTWVQPPCDKHYQRGYIRSYMLYYCRHAGTCVDEPIEVFLPGYLTATNLTRLEPGEEYGIWMYSRTRAGLSLTHTDVIVAVASVSILTPAIIAVIAVSAAVFLILAVAAFWMLRKYCRRCHDKLWPPVTVSVPQANVPSNTDTAMSAPMLAYSRISYTRQGSRLSSSSRDSGQFGIASASPLMSPESPPDSVVFPLMASNNHVENAPPYAHGVTYVNDKIVFLRHPTENHQPPSPTPGKVEWFPLQPMQSHHPHDTSCTEFPLSDASAASADVHKDEIATDNVASSQQNGACDTVVNPNSDYIPHEWLKI